MQRKKAKDAKTVLNSDEHNVVIDSQVGAVVELTVIVRLNMSSMKGNLVGEIPFPLPASYDPPWMKNMTGRFEDALVPRGR